MTLLDIPDGSTIFIDSGVLAPLARHCCREWKTNK